MMLIFFKTSKFKKALAVKMLTETTRETKLKQTIEVTDVNYKRMVYTLGHETMVVLLLNRKVGMSK